MGDVSGTTCLPVGSSKRIREDTCPEGAEAQYNWIIGQSFDLLPAPGFINKSVHTGPKHSDSGALGFSQAPQPFIWGHPHRTLTGGFIGPTAPLARWTVPALDSQGLGLSSSEVTSGSMSFSFTFSVRSLKSFTSSWSRSLMTALLWLAVEAARSWPLRKHHLKLSRLSGVEPLCPQAGAEQHLYPSRPDLYPALASF